MFVHGTVVIRMRWLTVRVTRLGWEGGVALETEVRASQENAKKRGAYPKSGARIVRRRINFYSSTGERSSKPAVGTAVNSV